MIKKWILVGNSDLWLKFEEMIFIPLLKLLKESSIKFVGTVCDNLEATYAKVNSTEFSQYSIKYSMFHLTAILDHAWIYWNWNDG